MIVGSVACSLDEADFRSAIAAIAAGPLASMLLAVAAFWGALNAGPSSRPLEALLGYLAIVNALLAVLHCLPVPPFDAGFVLRLVLVRIGTKPNTAHCLGVVLGAVVGSCLILMGIWQLGSARGGLFGAWVVLAGALVMWALREPNIELRAPASPALDCTP
jgi:Zn-dependent protease